jgi:hypothetical protein
MVAEVVATETTGEPAAPAPPPPPTGDARLVHRGPIQRLLVRPEIGALLGTTAIWFFFWVVAPIFGTAAGTANYLDVAATLGIMAVAVSLHDRRRFDFFRAPRLAPRRCWSSRSRSSPGGGAGSPARWPALARLCPYDPSFDASDKTGCPASSHLGSYFAHRSC